MGRFLNKREGKGKKKRGEERKSYRVVCGIFPKRKGISGNCYDLRTNDSLAYKGLRI